MKWHLFNKLFLPIKKNPALKYYSKNLVGWQIHLDKELGRAFKNISQIFHINPRQLPARLLLASAV